ncbi:MAG: PQQ-binding-like beta-propeller repeat protein [Planctomycetota bacterium]
MPVPPIRTKLVRPHLETAGMLAGIAACALITLSARVAGAGDWPQFRGPDRNAISMETGLLREWPEGGPKVLWSVEACEGYAAAAVHSGRVYFNDYDKEAQEWLVRCLDLRDGKELWRFREKKRIRPNHGITRTVPAVDGKVLFSMDPKCTFHALDAPTGKELWQKNLVEEYGTVIPSWYTGQCPLLEGDRVLIAPGGRALVVALEKATGKPIWESPNPDQSTMTHASVMPATIDDVKQYLYCTLAGPVGVAADDGRILWSFPWKFNVAVPVSPLAVGRGLVFLTSCYEAETVMIRVERSGEAFSATKVLSLTSAEWNSETHTPIVYENHIFAVGKKKRGLFTCLDLQGNAVWTSEGEATFGLGSYILADGMFFVLEGDTGLLRLLEANTKEYRELASAQVLQGHDVWAPLALSDGKLLVRDMTKMVCLDVVGPHGGAAGDLSAGQ